MPKLLFLAGSARKESHNKKLAHAACDIAKELGADATFVDLKDYPMAMFCEDYEAEHGIPEEVKELKALFKDSDGFFIASPEYNSSFSALLKNALDWMSRKDGDEPMMAAFSGKVAALGAASPGALGGLRGLVPLRMMLGNIGVHVTPEQIAVGASIKAFNDDGTLADARQANMLKGVVAQLVDTAGLHAGESSEQAAA